jgi:hypothetical protein
MACSAFWKQAGHGSFSNHNQLNFESRSGILVHLMDMTTHDTDLGLFAEQMMATTLEIICHA